MFPKRTLLVVTVLATALAMTPLLSPVSAHPQGKPSTKATTKKKLLSVGQFISVRGGKGSVQGVLGKRDARTSTALFGGDTVTLPKGVRAVVVLYVGGKRMMVSGPTTLKVEKKKLTVVSGVAFQTLPPLSPVLVRALPNDPNLEKDWGGLISRAARAAPIPGVTPTDLRPFGVLRETPSDPTLRWKGADDPATVQLVDVTLIDKETGNTVLYQEVLPGDGTFPAPSSDKLTPGHKYEITVSAASDGTPVSAKGWFRVLSLEQHAALKEVEVEAAKIKRVTRDDTTREVVLAQNYTRLGMLPEAVRAYDAALKLVPDDDAVREARERLARLVRNQGGSLLPPK